MKSHLRDRWSTVAVCVTIVLQFIFHTVRKRVQFLREPSAEVRVRRVLRGCSSCGSILHVSERDVGHNY